MYNRSEFYCSSLMSHTVLRGDRYENTPEIILINILDYNMFDDDIAIRYMPRAEIDYYKGKYYLNINGKLYDEEMKVLKNDDNKEVKTDIKKYNNKLTTIHYIELKKFIVNGKERRDNINNDSKVDMEFVDFKDLSLWCKFLLNPNDKSFRNENTLKIYKKARSELLLLQDDKKFKMEYENRMNSIINEKSALMNERMEGYKEGYKEEYEKGLRIAAIMIAIKLLRETNNISLTAKITKLSEEEIILIDRFLKEEKENRNITDFAEQLSIDKKDFCDICDNCGISYQDRESKKIKLSSEIEFN